LSRGFSAGSLLENKLRDLYQLIRSGQPARRLGLSAELLLNTYASTKGTKQAKKTAKPAGSTRGLGKASKRLNKK
jgi:hypothetical protein